MSCVLIDISVLGTAQGARAGSPRAWRVWGAPPDSEPHHDVLPAASTAALGARRSLRRHLEAVEGGALRRARMLRGGGGAHLQMMAGGAGAALGRP